MKIPLFVFASITLMLTGIAATEAPGLKDCPREVLGLLRGDVRRAFLNITFSATTQQEEDAKLAELLAKGFGGPYLTFDADDKDNEYQVTISDGEDDKKRTASFLYNQTEDGWVLAGALLGGFPVGSPDKQPEGWRDISTREPMAGPGYRELIRTYRYTKDRYSQISQSVESGG